MQYAPITAILVEAVKEQQSIIEKLESQNITKDKEIETLKSQVNKLIKRVDNLDEITGLKANK